MSTLAELAVEYRKESAKLAMRIKEREAQGAPRWETEEMKKMLKEMRVKQRTLSGYYEIPRESCITMACSYAPKYTRDNES